MELTTSSITATYYYYNSYAIITPSYGSNGPFAHANLPQFKSNSELVELEDLASRYYDRCASNDNKTFFKLMQHRIIMRNK